MASSGPLLPRKDGCDCKPVTAEVLDRAVDRCTATFWSYLGRGVSEVLGGEPVSSPCDPDQFEALYPELRCACGWREFPRCRQRAVTRKVGALLRRSVLDSLESGAPGFADEDDDDDCVLVAVLMSWRYFRDRAENLEAVFQPVHHVLRVKPFPIAMRCWRERVLEPVLDRIGMAAVSAVARERDKGGTNLRLVSDVIKCFDDVMLRATYSDDRPLRPIVSEYVRVFEAPYVELAVEAHAGVPGRLLAKPVVCPLTDYLCEVCDVVAAEVRLAEKIWIERTLGRVVVRLEKLLLTDQAEFFRAELGKLVVGDRRGEFRGMCEEFGAIFARALEAAVWSDGLAAYAERRRGVAENEHFSLVISIAEVYEKYKSFIDAAFMHGDDGGGKSREFGVALKRACFEFFARNDVFLCSGIPDSQFLARMCYTVVKKNAGEEFQEVRVRKELEPVLAALVLVVDKTKFVDYFRDLIVYSFVQRDRARDDAASFVVSELEKCLPPRFRPVLRCHRVDVAFSRAFDDAFHILGSRESLGVDISARFVSTLLWNPAPAPEPPVVLPAQLRRCKELCEAFFFSSSRGARRQLTWVLSVSCGEVEATCFRRDYRLRLSTYQMCVVLCYEHVDAVTCGELRRACGLDGGGFAATVRSLTENRLLRVEGAGEEYSLADDAKIYLNMDFEG